MAIKVGFIGTGRIYKSHLAALNKIEEVKITAVCDILPEVLERTSKETFSKPYADYKEMLDKEKLDAVWICTPANVHTENALYCIEKKIPFFLEKPVAMSEKEGDEVAEKIRKTGIYHSVGYQLRYSPTVEKLKELLASEQVIFPAAEYFWTIPLVDSIKLTFRTFKKPIFRIIIPFKALINQGLRFSSFFADFNFFRIISSESCERA